MLKHIVFWKLKPQDKAANLLRMQEMLLALKGRVPQVLDLSVGTDIKGGPAAWDIALEVSLADEDALDAYQVHPEHEKVKQFIGTVTAERAVVDFLF